MMRRPFLLVVPLLAALLMAPAAASAQVSQESEFRESPKWFSTGLSFGAVFLNDSNIQATYGSQGRFMTKLHFGFVPWSKYVHIELDAGLGFLQFTGTQTFVDSGDVSSDKVMMTIFPVTVDLLVGIDLVDEQPVVPYGGIGLAMAFWREHETGGGDKWNGDRFGFNTFFGAAFLLDVIERSRSHQLDEATGINDAYITIEGRWADVKYQVRDGATTSDGLGFGGWSVTGGLKLVF